MPFIVDTASVEALRQLGPYKAGGGARPGALESKIWANGLVLNDQEDYDRYYVKSVDGLWGADIRDQREPKVNDDGEDVYDTLLGGKSPVITGRIEAHNLDMMRQMEQNLEAAFPHNFDYPVVFDRTGLRQAGIASNTLADKNFCTNPSVETNLSGYTTGTGPVLTRQTGFYKDLNGGDYYMSVVWHAGAGATLLLSRNENVPISTGQYVQVGIDVFFTEAWNGGDVQIDVTTNHGGVASADTDMPLMSDPVADSYIRGRWQRIWKTVRYDDATDGTAVNVSLTMLGAAVDADEIRFDSLMIRVSSDPNALAPNYFDGESSGWRWEGTPHLSLSSPDTNAYRQDVFIMARRIDKIALRDEQTNYQYTRDFQIPLRMGDPRIYSVKSKSVSTVPGQLTTLYVKNHGNYNALPRLHIVGPWSSFSIVNTVLLDGETVSRQFVFSGVSAGEYVDWNEADGTLISNGTTHVEGRVDSTANGLRLPRGTSVLTLGGSGLTAASQATVTIEDTWK